MSSRASAPWTTATRAQSEAARRPALGGGPVQAATIHDPGRASSRAGWVLTALTLASAVVLDFWIVPRQSFPVGYVVPFLVAAQYLSGPAVLAVGAVSLVGYVGGLQVYGDLDATDSISLGVLAVTLWQAYRIAAQRLEIARRTAEARAADRQVEAHRRELLAVVAHELRNPLTAASGSIQLLQRRERYDPRLVERVASQLRRLQRLARDLADLALPEAQPPTLERRLLDLTDVAQEMAEQARSTTSRHTINVIAPAAPLIGNWDHDRLEQILDNLLTNAIKYSPDGGQIVLRMTPVGGLVRIAVSDPGLGISPQDLPHVFDRFYRSAQAAERARGLGLGLYVVSRLVEAMHGRVSASSTLGQGSTFIVMLPRDLSRADAHQAADARTGGVDLPAPSVPSTARAGLDSARRREGRDRGAREPDDRLAGDVPSVNGQVRPAQNNGGGVGEVAGDVEEQGPSGAA